MHSTALVIFVLTYLGIALGGIPGLLLDRTGIALLGAIAMVAFGIVKETDAIAALDFPTLLLLYGLMVVSAQFRLSGFYARVAMSLTRALERPRRFLLLLMVVSAGLSTALANDIVCLAFTPIVSVALLRARLNPVPYLIGLACASNIGSAATVIGNPQNMLIGQLGGLKFAPFLAWCVLPSMASLAAAYGLILWIGGGALLKQVEAPAVERGHWPAFDLRQTRKGIIVTMALMVAFFLPVRREVAAMVAAGVLLCSRRMSTRSIIGLVDWHLMTLFCGIFIVVRGIELTDFPSRLVEFLALHGVNLGNLYVLSGVSVALSNLVSNVPAAMLLVKFLDPARPEAWYVLALSSTLAGNLVTIGSIANLITIEQAKAFGVDISFREHARYGVPVTLATLALLAAWIGVAASP